MVHENVIEFMSNSLWLSTDAQMSSVKTVTDAILNGRVPELRRDYEAARVLDGEAPSELDRGRVQISNGVARIPLSGPIAPKMNMFSMISGGTSAELFARNISALTTRDDVHTILIDVDSGGGSIHGIEAAAAAVRKARDVKRVWAVANYTMCSAAYWIGAAASKVFVTPTSNIGSIGVLQVLQFAKEEDQKRIEIIRSVPGKAVPNAFEPLSEDVRKKLQSDIDRIHASFIEAVSLNRNISMDKANELANGQVELGDAAVEVGLADAVVGSVEDVLAQIEAEVDADARFASLKSAFMALEQEKNELLTDIQEADQEVRELQSYVDALEDKLDEVEDKRKADTFGAMVDDAVRAGKLAPATKEDWITDLTEGNVTVEAFDRMVSNISSGTVVPTEEIEPNQATEASDPLAPANELEARVFASVPFLRKKFNL